MTSSRREQRSTRERSPRAHRPTPARRAPPTRSPWSRRAESPARHRSTAARPPRAMSRRRRRRRRAWREREATSTTMTWGPAPSVASVARRRGLGWREARPAGVPRARASLPWARTSEGTVRRRRDGELAVPRVGREPTRGKEKTGAARERRALRATSGASVSHSSTVVQIRKSRQQRVAFIRVGSFADVTTNCLLIRAPVHARMRSTRSFIVFYIARRSRVLHGKDRPRAGHTPGARRPDGRAGRTRGIDQRSASSAYPRPPPVRSRFPARKRTPRVRSRRGFLP